MRRLYFIVGAVATAVYVVVQHRKPAVAMQAAAGPQTWAEHIEEITTRTHTRRYEHLTHVRVCNGYNDQLYSPAMAAERKRRCAEICGLCRYLYTLAAWPDPNYRRPPEDVLKALEREPYHCR
jgi:hypothetical protein